jgi:hypothetical protein
MSELNALMCLLRKFKNANFIIPNSSEYIECELIRRIIAEPIEDIKERNRKEIETNRSNYDRVISSIAGIKYIAFIRQDIPCLQCYMTSSTGMISLCKQHILHKRRFLHPFTYSQFINQFTNFQPYWENSPDNNELSRFRRYHPLYNNMVNNLNNDDIFNNNLHALLMNEVIGRKYVSYINNEGCTNCYAYGSSIIEVCRNCIDDFNAGKIHMTNMDYLEFVYSSVFINPQSFYTYERLGIINNLNPEDAIYDEGTHPIRNYIEIDTDDYMFMDYIFWGME